MFPPLCIAFLQTLIQRDLQGLEETLTRCIYGYSLVRKCISIYKIDVDTHECTFHSAMKLIRGGTSFLLA